MGRTESGWNDFLEMCEQGAEQGLEETRNPRLTCGGFPGPDPSFGLAEPPLPGL